MLTPNTVASNFLFNLFPNCSRSGMSFGDAATRTSFPAEEEEEEKMEVGGEEEPFLTSSLPPVRLPLDYSLHSRHRTVLPKEIKGISDSSLALSVCLSSVHPTAIRFLSLYLDTECTHFLFSFFL